MILETQLNYNYVFHTHNSVVFVKKNIFCETGKNYKTFVLIKWEQSERKCFFNSAKEPFQ